MAATATPAFTVGVGFTVIETPVLVTGLPVRHGDALDVSTTEKTFPVVMDDVE